MTRSTADVIFFAVVATASIIGSLYRWWDRGGERSIQRLGSSNWPLSSARIQSRQVGAHMMKEGRGFVAFGGETPCYAADFFYSYTVDGEYYSEQFSSQLTLSETKAQDFLDALEEGQSVTIRYNPRKPERSAIFNSDNPGLPFDIL